MSEDQARRELKALRERIGKNDTALRQARQKRLEGEVSLKIIKVIKAAFAVKSPSDIDKVFAEADVQAAHIVNFLRENLG